MEENMELSELQQGLQDIQDQQQPASDPSSWLSMDNLMGSYGNWFSNDASLGEVLLQQLRERGVDTQAATEAMLRELLGGLVDDLNLLQQRLVGFVQETAKQLKDTKETASAVQTALATQGASPMAQDMPPIDVLAQNPMAGAEQVPPEAGAGQMPPEAGAGQMPPEVMTQTPPEAGAEQLPPEIMSQIPPEAMAQMQPDIVSDNRLKNVRYVLSDAGMKKIKALSSKPKGNLAASIISACQGGF